MTIAPHIVPTTRDPIQIQIHVYADLELKPPPSRLATATTGFCGEEQDGKGVDEDGLTELRAEAGPLFKFLFVAVCFWLHLLCLCFRDCPVVAKRDATNEETSPPLPSSGHAR